MSLHCIHHPFVTLEPGDKGAWGEEEGGWAEGLGKPFTGHPTA